MTGRHTGHCTVRQNGQFLNASDVTVATVLKKAGYATALVGKWGLGKETLVLYYPHYTQHVQPIKLICLKSPLAMTVYKTSLLSNE